jgi:hypothetical protein
MGGENMQPTGKRAANLRVETGPLKRGPVENGPRGLTILSLRHALLRLPFWRAGPTDPPTPDAARR